MASSLINKLTRFLRSPQGQKITRQAKEFAAKPENQRKLKQLGSKIGNKRRGH